MKERRIHSDPSRIRLVTILLVTCIGIAALTTASPQAEAAGWSKSAKAVVGAGIIALLALPVRQGVQDAVRETQKPHPVAAVPLAKTIFETSRIIGLAPEVIKAVQDVESGPYKKSAETVTSSAGAVGLMQVMPNTGRFVSGKLGRPLNLKNPADNFLAGAWYLDRQQKMFGSLSCALSAYNRGPYDVGMFCELARELMPDRAARTKGEQVSFPIRKGLAWLVGIPTRGSAYAGKVKRAHEKYDKSPAGAFIKGVGRGLAIEFRYAAKQIGLVAGNAEGSLQRISCGDRKKLRK